MKKSQRSLSDFWSCSVDERSLLDAASEVPIGERIKQRENNHNRVLLTILRVITLHFL